MPFVFRMEGKVSYTDGTSADFGASRDEDGNIKSEGNAATLGDVIAQVKALFTELGGTLTCSPATSGKTVRDYTARIDGLGVVAAGTKYEFFAERTVKTGVHSQGAADYVALVAEFSDQMEAVIADLADVAATVV